MHVVSVKTGLKLIVLLVLGILLIISLALLVYQSKKALTKDKAAPVVTENPSHGGRADAERTLALYLDPKAYPFVNEYRGTDRRLEINVDGRKWKLLSPRDRKSYLLGIADARSALGLQPEVKILDKRTSVEIASFERGRIILGEDQDGS